MGGGVSQAFDLLSDRIISTVNKNAMLPFRAVKILPAELGDNAGLDGQGFSPFGKVVSGMEVVDQLYGGYGEGAPNGNGPDQGRIQSQGNAYLEQDFPKLDFIKSATIAE